MKHILAFFLLAAACFAQTTVTGTVVDPNNNPYANGTASAQTLAASGQATTSTTPVATNLNGAFSMTLAAKTYIFTICAAPTQLGPTANPTPVQVCFQSLPIAISGGSIDISSQLNSVARILGPKLTGSSSGGSSSLPGYTFAQFGVKGDGVTDDTANIQSAINACPQISPTIGCMIYAVGTIGTLFKTSSAISLGLLQGVHIIGVGTCGINVCTSQLQTNGAIWGWTIGTGSNPNTSGFVFENIGCQDMTGNGLGCFDILATNSGEIRNVTCTNYVSGACYELDGGINFTQWIHFYNTNFWHAKYGFQSNNKTASIFIWGGQGNCVNAGVTDVIAGSVAIDIGYTNHAAGTGTGSEWSVDYQAQNCAIGTAIWNGGGNHFWGKAIENTFIPRPNQSFGVIVEGDATCGGSCSFLANGNFFDGVQVTGAGTGFYLTANVANTSILAPIFNGTNGVDLVIDQTTLGGTLLWPNKRWTGSLVNLATIARSGNVVTATTVSNAYLSIFAQTLISISNVTGGTTSFNGQFPVTSVSTNDTTGVTTLTWSQTGANESGTVNGGGCQGAGSCVAALSTMQISGVGTSEITGANYLQDVIFNQPTLSTNQALLPSTCQSSTARMYFDGAHMVLCDAGNGLAHLVGYTSTFNGGTGNSYTPQPVTVLKGGSGNVNTSGTAMTITPGNGTLFSTSWANVPVSINFIPNTIVSCASQTSCTLGTSAGTQTGVPYNTSGITGVPPCSVSTAGVCNSADSNNHIVFTNTGGTTLCLPPPGTANGYPPNFWFIADYEPGSGSGFLSITPSGATSLFSIACAGTASQFRLSSSSTNLSINQGTLIYTDGTNWFALSGFPTISIDQIQPGLTNNQTYTIQGAPWNAGGSTGKGESLFFKGGLSNATADRAGDVGLISGPNSTSGTQGDLDLVQTLNAGISLAGKEGYIVRPCKDVTNTDCQNTVPSGNSGAVRLSISGTDTGGGVGIVFSGNPAGNPVQVQLGGVYGHNTTDGAIVETNCPSGQINYYSIPVSNTLDNGAGECSTIDSPRRVGYALLAVTGCSQASPCRVPVLISPASGSQGQTQWGSVSGCVSNGAACNVTLTWPTAFADTSYQAICTPIGPEIGNPSGAFWYTGTQTTTTLVVTTNNLGTTNAGGYTTFVCMGHHN